MHAFVSFRWDQLIRLNANCSILEHQMQCKNHTSDQFPIYSLLLFMLVITSVFEDKSNTILSVICSRDSFSIDKIG